MQQQQHYTKALFKLYTRLLFIQGVERAWISWLPRTLNEVVLAVVNPSEDANRPLVFYLNFEYRNPLAVSTLYLDVNFYSSRIPII